MELRIPDRTNPIIGWRSWVVFREEILDEPSFGPVLTSFNGEVWPPTPKHASCRVDRWSKERIKQFGEGALIPCREAPTPECCCGIYATKTQEEAWNFILPPWRTKEEMIEMGILFGQTALWGKVQEHETGYRAEWAQIINGRLITKTFSMKTNFRRLARVLSDCYQADIQ